MNKTLNCCKIKMERYRNISKMGIIPKIFQRSFKIIVDYDNHPTQEKPQTKPRQRLNEPPVDQKCSTNKRINEVNIEMLLPSLFAEIFGNDAQKIPPDPTKVKKATEELKKFGFWQDAEISPDVDFKLPTLEGKNVEEHFWKIGEQQSGPYKKLLLDFVKSGLPKKPDKWLLKSGWTKYVDNREPESVAYPSEDALVFDVEVCMKLGTAPTLATAVSRTAWYGWVSRTLASSGTPAPVQRYTPDLLIPMEEKTADDKARIVVGHNVSYDRARVKEQYFIKNSGLRFFDTMSMHISIGGVTSYQRAMLKTKISLDDDDWREYSSLNSLKEVYKLYCKKELSKDTRNLFVNGDLCEIRNDFDTVMAYCAGDVDATFQILQKMAPLFFERFPHPVTLAGMLELGTAYLPINSNWQRYLTDSEQTFDDLETECKFLLARKCDNACQLMHDEKYKEDLWMWDEDWSTQDLCLTKKKIKPEERVKEEDEDELDQKYRHLFDMKAKLPVRLPYLPGYPLWYRKLCEKRGDPDWVPGPRLVSTGVKVTPKLLNLTWEGYPLHYTREHGWGILVADVNAEVHESKVPFEKLKNLTMDNQMRSKRVESLVEIDVRKKVDQHCGKEDYWMRKGSKPRITGCDHVVENCYFSKLPHKDGIENNVGNPLAKDFLKTFSKSVLAGADGAAEKVLAIGRMVSYWRNNRERIGKQLAVWHGPDSGAILPQVVVCGTLTRRAMEPTWMTASNAQSERVGSELRCMIQAPAGYHLVGADVDSQELWIAAVIGDSAFAQLHGSTPFGWMTLRGNKANGTDMHSVTAAAAGISRDHAKTINYARIYGAGVRFAQRLLQQFNPEMSDTEAKAKAAKMFLLTKGKKIYRLKEKFKNQMESEVGIEHSVFSATRIAKYLGKPVGEVFERPVWEGGTESAMFNRLEEVACSRQPRTPFLSARLSRAVEPRSQDDDSFLTTRVNWVVQSGAADYLHLMLVSLRWLSHGKMKFCLSFHDEVRYLVPSDLRYEAALALHVTNLLTRAFCARRLGLNDLPQSVAFFSSVEVDTVLRKEAGDDGVTPSNPHGLLKGYGISSGESLDIFKAVEMSGEMSEATKRKHVFGETIQDTRIPLNNEQIVRILSSKGNNLHQVETADGSTFLASMPVKFRKNVWIKRGDFIVVEPIAEGDKVKVEMVAPLTKQNIKFLKSHNHWPAAFTTEANFSQEDQLFENTNRPLNTRRESSDDDSDS